jgi:hypothetical protein
VQRLGPSVAKMEWLFSIEAKSFRFSSKEGSSLFRLEERRKKFVGYILVSTQGSSWLIDMVEAASQAKENIVKSFREGDKAMMVHGGSNRLGDIWRCPFMRRVAEKGYYGSRRVDSGGGGVSLLANCV